MTRAELEHVIRAAADIADDDEIVVQNANTRGAAGLCLEVHDLLVSKLIAGRDKALAFARDVVAHGLVREVTLGARLAATALDPAERTRLTVRIEALFQP